MSLNSIDQEIRNIWSMAEGRFCILVSGMHRCGTSALAGCIQRIGFDLGYSMMPKNKFNEYGYYENNEIYEFNKNLFSEEENSWDLKGGCDLDIQITEERKNTIKDLLASEFDLTRNICIKDPRLSFTLHIWIEALEELGFECVNLICIRAPQEVIHSLKRRNGFSFEKSSHLYWNYVLSAFVRTKGKKRKVVDYNKLLNGKQKYVFSLFKDFKGINMGSSEVLKESLNLFLRSSLNHGENNIARIMVSLGCQNLYNRITYYVQTNNLDGDAFNQEMDAFRELSLVEEAEYVLKDNEVESLLNKIDRLERQVTIVSEVKNDADQVLDKITPLLQTIVDNDRYNQNALRSLSNEFRSFKNITTENEISNLTSIEMLENLIAVLNDGKVFDLFNYLGELKVHFNNSVLRRNIDRDSEQLENVSQIFEDKFGNLVNSLRDDNENLAEYVQAESQKVSNLVTENHRLSQEGRVISARYEILKKEFSIFKKSKSALLGFAITYPLRKIYDLFFSLFGVNLVILRRAIENKESYREISINALYKLKLLSRSPGISKKIITLSQETNPVLSKTQIEKNYVILPNRYEKSRVAVYTALVGGYDTLRDPFDVPSNVDYFVFSDKEVKSKIWESRPMPYYFDNDTRAARFVKTHPHLLLPDYEVSIWVDANLEIVGNIRSYLNGIDDYRMITWKHPFRSNIFEEAEKCILMEKDNEVVINEQISLYQELGFKDDILFETSVIVRRHNETEVISAMASWWDEIVSYSSRDQLSLPYIRSIHNLPIGLLNNGIGSMRDDSVVAYHNHKN